MWNPFKRKTATTTPIIKLRNAMASRNSRGMMNYYKDIDSYKNGGIVKKTGLAYVHKGEKIINNKKKYA